LVGAAALVVTAPAAPASAAPSPGRHSIPNSTPKWLSKAKNLGAAPSNDQITFGVLLDMRNADEAAATLQRISDPDNPDYGKWLTNQEFDSQFAPTASDVAAVRNWLSDEGFRVQKTLPSGMYIEASGATAQIDKVFGTTVNQYTYRNKTVHANATALSLPPGTPDAVTGLIGGVLGIDQGEELHTPADMEPGPAAPLVTAQPCSDYYGQRAAKEQPQFNGKTQTYDVCGYTPGQLQSAYGESSLLRAGTDGRGETIAVVSAYASPTIVGDTQKYNAAHHQPAFRAGQYRQFTPGPNGFDLINECGAAGWYGEQTLDIEAAHAMAPGANIVYVGAADCDVSLNDAWAETIDSHAADIVTDSWGTGIDDPTLLGADQIKLFDQFSLEAALTGITVNFAPGDGGDFTNGGANPAAKTVSFPADEPFVTAVGGTTIAIGPNGQREFETGWQTTYSPLGGKGGWGEPVYNSGGGGGTSTIYAQPFYQRGAVPASDSQVAGGKPMRAIPDIAVEGDPNTGFVVGQTQAFLDGTRWAQYRIGGTSLASPLLAGIVAVADQKAHRKLGFINPLYYKLSNTSAINDIAAPKQPVTQVRADYLNGLDPSGGTMFRLETIDTQTTTLHDQPGYDTETGVGSPEGPQFFTALAK
jgi:subtilase family serine protease